MSSSNRICRFPLFLSLGQVDCDLEVNAKEIVLSEREINDIKLFHFSLFKKVIKIRTEALVFDKNNRDQSFFVVPVEKDESNTYALNWDVILCDFVKDSVSAVVRYNPFLAGKHKNQYKEQEQEFLKKKIVEHEIQEARTSESTSNCLIPMSGVSRREFWKLMEEEEHNQPSFIMSEADFKCFIISPVYRNFEPEESYFVVKICHNLTPLSPFPNKKYENYLTYYKEKHFVDITNLNQPLLKVKPAFKCSNMNKPRIRSANRKSKDWYINFEQHFIPEICAVFPFSSKYWIKAMMLPSVLNRIVQLYLLDEFRRNIAKETGLGVVDLPAEVSWKPLKSDMNLFKKEVEDDKSSFTNSFQKKLVLPLSELKAKTQRENGSTILDSERRLYEVGLCDLENYVRKIEGIEEDEEFNQFSFREINQEINQLKNSRNTEVPDLMIFRNEKNNIGPELCDFLQACTTKSANDLVNYEKLETFGDSFLKFAACLFLFKKVSKNEGTLTYLKGKLVGNLNLMYCGLAKNFQNVICATEFVPLLDWTPPSFCIPEQLINAIKMNNADPAVINRINIPYEEQLSGNLSEATLQQNENIIEIHEKCTDIIENLLLNEKVINDKTIADNVEALIGLYLKNLNLSDAFRFLTWMDILPKGTSFAELFEIPYQTPAFNVINTGSVMTLLNEVLYLQLEDTLGYHFRNKALLLEALTHMSYTSNRVTDSYQRLEFLGDAILDFLITAYISDYYSTLSPGQITDLRSSLVNNTVFACFSVRYHFHKHLLYMSASLGKAIENFAQFQMSRNHLIDENVMFLLEEKDVLLAETVQVPKVLGDVFESIAAAIFLDSQNSLKTVWNVYYRMMKREIDEFAKETPKNSFRLLTEICGIKPDCEVTLAENNVKVKCSVFHNNYEIVTHGFGKSKIEAKLSASKLALKKLLELQN